MKTEKSDLCSGHDAKKREENNREEGGDRYWKKLQQPEAAHQTEHIEAPDDQICVFNQKPILHSSTWIQQLSI